MPGVRRNFMVEELNLKKNHQQPVGTNIDFPKPLKVGNVRVEFPVVPAPMAGITDKPFRDIVKRFDVQLTFTEMVSSEALVRGNEKTRQLFFTAREEWPLAVQIFGSRPEALSEAAKIVENEGAAIIDINSGCPVKKIVKQGSGAALLREPAKLARILSSVTQSVGVPVTLKTRSGWDHRSVNVLEIARIAEDSGIRAITVHPRTATQLFRGTADWELIKQVKKAIKIPVIGNGDVKSPEDAAKMFAETGCDAVMVGRACIGNPWIFKQIEAYLEKGNYSKPGIDEIRSVGILHFRKVLEFYGKKGLPYARAVLIKYVKFLPGARETRHRIYTLDSPEEIEDFWDSYFARLGEHMKKTGSQA